MQRLFVYGTLGPGRPNEHIVGAIAGSWESAYVLGQLYKEGWGAEMGYPRLRLIPKCEKIEGHVFCSEYLAEHWSRLDAFEGAQYERVKTTVLLSKDQTEVEAYVYCLRSKDHG